MSGVTGDWRGLEGITAKIAAMADGVPKIAKVAATQLQPVVEAAVAAGQDAYGRAFAPLKGGGQPLATLDRPAKVTARGTSVWARVTRKVPRYLNRGRKGKPGVQGGSMPARPIIPVEGSEVPPKWVDVLEDAAARVMGERGR